jgi:hypothetical protein
VKDIEKKRLHIRNAEERNGKQEKKQKDNWI